MDKAQMTEDMKILKEFRLTTSTNHLPLTIQASRLLEGEMEAYVKKVMLEIGAPNEKVAASILVKRYAFFAVIALYTMSKEDRCINVNASNVTVVSHFENEKWLPMFNFEEMAFELNRGQREQWREKYVQKLFSEHLFLVMDQISKITNITKLILWENIAVYLFWLYESVLADDEERKEIIESDFRYLFYEAPGYVFGPYHQNPLTKYDSMKTYHFLEKRYIRARKTCCFSYQLPGATKRCSTCPCGQLDEEGRCQSEQSFCATIRSVNE